jgi:hypothetical protein
MVSIETAAFAFFIRTAAALTFPAGAFFATPGYF